MKPKIGLIIIILTLAAFSHAALIQSVSRTPLRPFSINQNYITDYSLNVNIPSAISYSATIEVEFPQPYQLTSSCKAYIKIDTGPFQVYSCSKPSYSRYVIDIGQITAGDYQIVFENIQNPSTHPGSSNFKIRTYMNQNILVDSNEYLDSVPFLPAPKTSTNATVENIGYTTVSLGSKFDFKFGLQIPLAKGDSIKINFPEGFFLLKPACFHRNSGTYAQTESLHNNRSLICQAFQDSMSVKDYQVVSIIGVVNPEYAGFFQGFFLETIEGVSANVYEKIVIPNYIKVEPGVVTMSIQSASTLLSTNTTHLLSLMFENDVPATGEIWIRIPPGFRYLAANCTLLRPLEAQPNGEVTCELAANKTGYIIRGFTGISASQSLSVEIVAENPPTSADYKIQVFSFSTVYNAKIDQAFDTIHIDPQYGASKFYKSHSLRWTRRLKHTETGPLEFTFFLNIPLPATASTFYGKILIDIRPQIPTPSQGTLRCFFYNTIPAQTCTWDTSNPTKTTITIKTPTTDPYFQSEIPITITTEDAVGTPGVTLPQLIQRYKFYFYFWRNGDAKEHEVYYEDYIVEPMEIAASSITFTVAPLQYNEEAFINIRWYNDYMNLGTGYFFELEFDHSTPGWDYNLGWGATDAYGRYTIPCIVTSLGSNYKCILNPGGAAGTNSTLQVIGISSISYTGTYYIRIPKMLVGTSGTAGVRFTLYQNTPGETTHRIPIMYKDFVWTPTASSGLSYAAPLTVSLGSSKPDIDTSITFSFTTSISSPRYIIYEYPSLYWFATQTTSCGGYGNCHIFTTPVRWIVFEVTTGQGTNANTPLSAWIHTPPYIGTFNFKAKSENSNTIGDKKTQGPTITAGALSVTFTLDSNPEVNKNSIVLFYIYFVTITKIYPDGSILLTFTNLAVPDADDFYCEYAGLSGLTTVGVICEKMSATTIKLYNLNTVAAGTGVTIRVQLWTNTATSLTCKVESFYDRSATSTMLIDTGSSTYNPISYSYDNLNSASIISDRSGEIVRAGTYGCITLKLTPSQTYNSATMTIAFGTGFSTSTASDVLYCKLNTVRVRCSYTIGTGLTVTMSGLGSTYLTAGTQVTIFITSDYSDPTIKGIKAPSTPGFQHISIDLTDTSVLPNRNEKIGKYIYVYPNSVPDFTVTPYCTTADAFTMFLFTFTLKTALNSNSHATSRGRIYIEFPTGSENFKDDLGTGLTTGGVIGCNIISGLSGTVKCRLVKSPGSGLPAAVEIIGFNAVSSGTSIQIRVSRVRNPPLATVGEYTFGLRTEHVSVTTGDVTPLEYAIYYLWHRVYVTSVLTYSNTAYYATFNSGSVPNQVNQPMTFKMYSNVAFVNPGYDYYIIELPSDIQVNSVLSACPSYVSGCFTVPEIGWVVFPIVTSGLSANTGYDGTIYYITNPSSYPRGGYTITSYIWKNMALDHYMTHTVQSSHVYTVTGTFSSASIAMNSYQLVKSRAKTEITLTFYTASITPSTGTFEIRFPSGVTPRPYCKSTPSMGSALTSSTGRVACTIQSNSWLITNFDTLAAGSKIVIYGFVDLPSISTTTSNIILYSYSNQHATDIATNGNPIDRLLSAPTISIQNYNTLSLDASPSQLVQEPIVAQSSYYRPFIFDFTLRSSSVGTSNYIKITISNSAFTDSVSNGGTLICSFLNLNTNDYVGCDVYSTYNSGGIVIFTLRPAETLVASTVSYRGTITTVFATNGNDGILLPSTNQQGTYQVNFWADVGGSTSDERDVDFLEVMPSKFSSLIVKNYIIAPGEEDVIDITLTVPTTAQISTSNRLIIELPTLFNSTNMFAEDLGQGLADGQDKLCELITSAPTASIGMSCYFQKGNRYAKTPATIVVYGFTASFHTLRFAFTVNNPSVSTPTVIPLTIYSVQNSNPFFKTYYQYVEKAIVVVSSGFTATNSDAYTNSYNNPTVKGTSTLTVRLYWTSYNLYTSDYYVFKTPQMGSAATAATSTVSIGGVSSNCLVLPKNKFIVLSPSSAIGPSYYAITISNIANPDQGIASNLYFTAYITHFSAMIHQKTTYPNPSADFTGITSFTSVAVTTSNNLIYQYSILSFAIQTSFKDIRSVIIRIPSELSLREDCYEAYNNQIETLKCTLDTTNRYVFVTLEDKVFPTADQYLRLSVPVKNGGSVGTISAFDYYLYTTVQTNPGVSTGQRYAVSSSSGISLATSSGTSPPSYINLEYVPYNENRANFPAPYSGDGYGEIKFSYYVASTLSSSYNFKIYLPSSILSFDSITLGDITSQPAVHVCDPAYSINFIAIATYSSGILSFSIPSGNSLTGGSNPVFRITEIGRSGDSVGIRVITPYTATEYPVIMEIYNGGTLSQTAQLGTLYLSSSAPYTVTLSSTMTRAASQLNVWEFSLSSIPGSIDNLYIDFPVQDEYGNPLFDYNLGAFTDKSTVACSAANTNFASGLTNPECIFFIGTTSTAQAARIWVRGLAPTGASILLYIAGAYNPAAGRRIYFNFRFYSSTTYQGSTMVLGYSTTSAYLSNSGTANWATSNYLYSRTPPITYTFNTGVTINTGNIILVGLDSSCTTGSSTSGGPYYATGSTGAFAFTKAASSVSSTYTFNNFVCGRSYGSTFTLYHVNSVTQTSGSSGETRTATYYHSTQSTVASITLSTTGNNYVFSSYYPSRSGLNARLTFNVNAIQSYVKSSSYILEIEYSAYYFSSIDSCQVLDGLNLVTPNKPVTCTTSGTKIKISDFSGITGSTSYLKVYISYTSASSFSTGSATFKLFASSAHYSAGDYATYSTLSSLAVSGSSSGTSILGVGTYSFPVAPYPGRKSASGNIQFYFGGDFSFGGYNYIYNADRVRIKFDTDLSVLASTSCSLSTPYYSSCSVNTGAGNNYIDVYTNGNYGNYLQPFYFYVNFLTDWPDSYGPYFFTIQYIRYDGVLMYQTPTLAYQLKGSQTVSFTATPLHTQTSIETEYNFRFSSVPIALDTSTIFTVKYSSVSVKVNSLDPMDCICTLPASCYNYQDGTGKYIDMVLTTSYAAYTTVECYVPDITHSGSSETFIGRIIDAPNRNIYFETTISTITWTGLTSNAHSLSVPYPAAPIYPTTTTSMSPTISSPGSYSASSYMYVNFGAAGPVPPSCGASAITDCRSYSTVRNIYVAKVPGAGSSTLTLFSDTVSYPYDLSETSANYTVVSLVTTYPSILSRASSSLTMASFSPQQTSVYLTASELKYNLFSTMTLKFSTGSVVIPKTEGRIIITLTSITNMGSYCYASISKVSIPCSISSSTITITPDRNIATSSQIEILFTGNNPSSGSPTITLKGYSYYYSSGSVYNSLVLGATSFASSPSYTSNSGSFVSLSYIKSFVLITKTLNPTKAPIRVRFRLASGQSLSNTNGKVILTIPSVQSTYNGNPVGYFRTYYNELHYTEVEGATSVSGTTITITTPSSYTISSSYYYEVVLTTDATSNPHFDTVTSTANQLTVTFDDGLGTVYSVNKLDYYPYRYPYSGNRYLYPTAFYYMNNFYNDANTLVLTLYAETTINVFSTSIIEIELSSAVSGLIKSGYSTSDRSVPCGITSTVSKRSSSTVNARCALVHTSPAKIRIENYASIAAGTTFNLILYDLLNSIIARDSLSYFDAVIRVTDVNAKTQGNVKLTRMYVTRSGSASPPSSSGTFFSSSTSTFASSTTLSKSITWQSGDDCSPCRFIVRNSGTNWKFKTTGTFQFSIAGWGQNIILDEINNAFIVLSTINIALSATNSYSFNMYGSTLLDPLPYESLADVISVELYALTSSQYQNKRTWTFSGSYPTLTWASLSGTSGYCSVINNYYAGINGNVACRLSLPLTSSILSNIVAVRVDLTNPSTGEYSVVYPTCEAYVSGGSAGTPGGQLACSRLDTSSTQATFMISGFTFVTGSSIDLLFKARGKSNTYFTADVFLQIKQGTTYYTVHKQTGYGMPITGGLATSYYAPTKFSVRTYVTDKTPVNKKMPFKIVTNVESAMVTGGFFQLVFENYFTLQGSVGVPICTVRYESTYGVPLLTNCAYDSSNRIYTFYLLSGISTTGRYVLEITTLQTDILNEGVLFPPNTGRFYVRTQVNSPSNTAISVDLIYFALEATPFTKFSISDQQNQVGSTMSQFDVTIQAPAATTADTTSNENILVLEFPTPLYDSDLGASTVTYAADGHPYYNGMQIANVITSGLGTSTIAVLHYGTSTEPARIVISKHTGFTTAAQTISLAMIKNPAAPKPFRINAYLLQYYSGQAYPTVMYQISYVSYSRTVYSAGESTSALSWYFSSSNPGAEQGVSIYFNSKYFGHSATPSSKLYIKLQNAAQGFDYSAMTAVSCSNFNVEWFKAGYIFFLTPTYNMGTSPAISCSGFIMGTTKETVTLETGLFESGYTTIYASSGSVVMSPLTYIPSESPTASRDSTGISNGESVNRYTLTYSTGSFILKAGGYLVVNFPSSRAVTVAGLTEYINIGGLKDNTSGSPPSSLQGVILSTNSVKITGYKDFKSSTDGSLVISLFLKNVAAGSMQFTLTIYDEKGSNIGTTSAFTDLPVSSLPTASSSASFGPFLTDAADVFAGQLYRMFFKLNVKTTPLTYATSSQFLITLPSGFSITSTKELCKYSVDSGVHWIRSPCYISSTYYLYIPLISGFDVSSNVLIMVTSENANLGSTGVYRSSSSTTYHKFNVKVIKSSTTYESVYLPFIVYPDPNAVTITSTWYNRVANDYSVVEVRFTSGTTINPTSVGDFFELDFVTYDDIGQVFPNDLGTGITEKYTMGDCAQYPTTYIVSTTINLKCKIALGKASATPFIPSKVIIQNDKYIYNGYDVRLFIAKVQNPGSIPGGFVFNVMRKCRNDGFGCPLYRRREYKNFGVTSPKYQDPLVDKNVRAAPFSTKKDVLDTQSSTTFTFKTLRASVTTSDAIVLKYSSLNMLITTDCTATAPAFCIHFPRISWTFFQPASTLTAGSNVAFSLSIDNAFFYDRTNPTDFLIEPWTSGSVQQITYGSHPDYNVKVPALQTDATQTDLSNQYIVRNFDNILQLSMSNIWRTNKVRKIIVNTPSSYIAITNTYCMAGIDLTAMSSSTYIELPCQVTGSREITIVVNDPTAWTSYYSTQPVVVFFRGFLPVDDPSGATTTSTITSYADLTLNYVIDENTGYGFTVSPTPTPFIRDVNLNLKSMNDRNARINDYVMFYAAVWPNTLYSSNPISQLLFEVDNDYLYPSLANFLCVTKVVFKIQVSCTLKRKQGRTQIYVSPPPSYQNSPFLLTITNTDENLLFVAPSREGSFKFNLTYLDASGNQIEKADSYMDISGEFVQSFTAEPIQIDPLVQTLHDFKFKTATRVTPQGFYEAGQTVYTQIVFLFQTYSPAYPIDLGTGLTDGSEMSCVAAQGITLNKKKKLTCTLVYGTPIKDTKIIVTGYDAIPASTSVQILIDEIKTLAVGVTSRVKLEIQSIYPATNTQFIFYNSLEVSPTAPTNFINGGANGNFGVTRSATSNVLRERSSYTVQIYPQETSPISSSDYIILDFPKYGYELEADYSSSVVSFTSPAITCKYYIMPRTNRIYIIPGSSLGWYTWHTFTIQNLPNPSFYLTGTSTFTAKSIIGRKWRDYKTVSVSLTSVRCQLFSNEQITYNSSYIRMNENIYQISFNVLHAVPSAGSLAILFDSHYNLRLSSPTCQLVQGFSSAATCVFELFSQQLVRIKLNGQAIESGTFVQLNIINVNNPTDNTAPSVITIQSYFDSAFDSTYTICSKPITLPTFNTLTSIKCPVTVAAEINNANEVTDYIITLACSGDIRNATNIDVQFPLAFLNKFASDLSCSTNGNYMLQKCSVIAKTTRVSILISKPSVQQNLIIRIRGVTNPVYNGTYGSFAVNLYQYSVLYGGLDSSASTASVVITSNDIVKTNNKLTLSIFPRNYGEKATYFFMLPGISVKKSPTELYVTFDTAFSRILGPSLECGTFTPQDQYGKNYALNYENLKDLQTFPCEVVDDYKIKLTISPTFNILPNNVFNMFFYIKNIINPSINSQTSYSFKLTFTTSGSAALSSQNTITISYGLPPSLLQIKSFGASDTNILAPTTYTFTLQATTGLPASTSTSVKEYELLLNLPTGQYPAFSQNVQVVYSFPDTSQIQSTSSAFNFQSSIFFAATYPNLATLGAFRLTLSNITNPSTESTCGLNAAGSLVKFETEYVSRQQGLVYAKSYPISDQQNCLPLGKTRDAIKVICPLYLRRGLTYTISLQVEDTASDLQITPISTFLIFDPKSVSFTNYQSRSVSLKVIVPKNIPKGDYTIQWKKKETGTHINYLELEDTRVIVVDESSSASITPIPKVRVENIKYVWTGTMARDVLVTLDMEPAEDLVVDIKAKTNDTKVQGSADGLKFSKFPISIKFIKGQTSQKFYIIASDGAKDNVLSYSLSGSNAKSYDSKIADTPYVIQTQLGATNFQILSLQQIQVLENKASFLATLSNVGTIFYLYMTESTAAPTRDQIVAGQISGVDSQFYKASSIQIQKIEYGSSYSSYINITSLASQTKYKIYFTARSSFGEYTDVITMSFKTLKVSQGSLLLIPTLGNITSSSLIDALSIILPLPKSRLIFSGAEEFPTPVYTSSNQAIGSQLNGYRVMIAPDPNNNSPTPLEIANTLLVKTKQDQLAALVPTFYQKVGLRVTPVERIAPRVIIKPTVKEVSYYTARIGVELIEAGKVYAIAIRNTTQNSSVSIPTPTSYQISKGLAANNQKVDTSFYKAVSTNKNGEAEIVFDELRDFTEYFIYITASNDVPYEPADLLDDSEIMKVDIKTLKNPNVGNIDEATVLYNNYFDKSSNRLTRLLWGTFLMFLAVFYI